MNILEKFFTKKQDLSQNLYKSGLWLDNDNAFSSDQFVNANPQYQQIATDLIKDGLAIAPFTLPQEDCDIIMADYKKHLSECDNILYDKNNHECRLVNFHTYSEKLMSFILDEKILSLFDFLFGKEACVYTSLTFKYGTGQPVHRDVPHFATWPYNMFFGMWIALEDIDEEAGPLFYYPKGHKQKLDGPHCFKKMKQQYPNLSDDELYPYALSYYNDQTAKQAKKIDTKKTIPIKKGQIIIWHPQLPHGGSTPIDPEKTRFSTVFHMACKDVHIHHHDEYFSPRSKTELPKRYEFKKIKERFIAKMGCEFNQD